MKKVKEIYYIDNRQERASDFSTGFVFILEDGSRVETMTTDTIAERYMKPSKDTTEQYKCQSYVINKEVLNCTCGKCF